MRQRELEDRLRGVNVGSLADRRSNGSRWDKTQA
jgi:hypothetical protein